VLCRNAAQSLKGKGFGVLPSGRLIEWRGSSIAIRD
jgi:hypothetical protein